MKIPYFIIAILIHPFVLFSQTFMMGHTSLTLIDIERCNRRVPVEIYYPADSAGDNVPVSSSGSFKFPVVCFGHGYMMSWDCYNYIRDALVKNGYIIAYPKTEEEMFPSHLDLARDISFLLRSIRSYGGDERSIFFGRLHVMNCAMGHSMGGGSAVLAAEYDSSIKALAILAPADTRPSSVEAASSVRIPALIIAGKNDCITRPETHQLPMFNSLKSDSKTMITIIGGSHCQMADGNFPCHLAEMTCGKKTNISKDEQHEKVIRYLLPWLNYHLREVPAAGELFDTLAESDQGIVIDRRNALTF